MTEYGDHVVSCAPWREYLSASWEHMWAEAGLQATHVLPEDYARYREAKSRLAGALETIGEGSRHGSIDGLCKCGRPLA